MAEDSSQYKSNFEGEVKSAVVGEKNIIYNYFYYREGLKAKPVEPDEAADEQKLPCPYRGLFHFGPNDADVFFGRDVFVEKLFQATQNRNFIPVLGASGSGKSSVVLAGLVPKLQQESHWKFTHFRPGSDPFHALALALVPLYTPELDDTDQIAQARKLASYLSDTTVPLSDVLAKIQQNHFNHRMLLIADQFEELYTQCPNETVRRRFLDCLLSSFQSSISPSTSSTVLVTTMRADFLGNALSYRPFADMLQNVDIKLGAMSREELTEVIEKPAKRLGVTFETGLVERILDDVENEPGNLPLLEFALTELWTKRTGKQLTHHAYEAIAQVKGALADYADEKYNNLTPDEQEQVRRIFIQLVRPGEGTEDTRRRANRAELGEENWDLVTHKDGLADSRLVVTGRNDTGQETVEVVHEALIQNWGKLQEWMATDRSFRAWQERLRTLIHQWEEIKQDEGTLLRGVPLAEAEDWLQKRPIELSFTEQEYIRQSVERRDRLVVEEEKRRQRELEQEKKARRAAQSRTRIALLSAFLLGIGAIFANNQRLEIKNRSELTALREEAATSRNLSATEPRKALALAIKSTGKSLSLYNEVISPVQYSLSSAIDEVRGRTIFAGHNSPVLSVAFSPDGKTIVSGGADRTIRRWDLQGNLIGEPFRGHEKEVSSVAVSPDGKTIVSSDDETIRLWNLQGTPLGSPFKISSGKIGFLSFSQDGKTIISSDGVRIQQWDLQGHLIQKPFNIFEEDSEYTAIAFNPKKSVIASNDKHNDEVIHLWDLQGNRIGQLSKEPQNEPGPVWYCSLALSPDNRQIVGGICPRFGKWLSSYYTPKIRLWLLDKNGQPTNFLKDYKGHETGVQVVAFSPDGGNIISADGNKARLWKNEWKQSTVNLGRNLVLNGHISDITAVAFSPNGKQVVTASFDSTLQLWDLTGLDLMTIDYRDPGENFDYIGSTAFSPDGKLIAGAQRTGSGGSVRLWNVEGNLRDQGFQNDKNRTRFTDVASVAFSPDGKTIVSGNEDDTLWLWDLNGNPIGQPFEGHEGDVVSVDFSPDGKTIVSGSYDQTLRLWDLNGNPLGQPFEGHEKGVASVAFSPDGKTILSGSYDQTLRLWDLKGNPIGQPFVGHDGGVTSVAFSPDGKTILSGSYDQTLRLWDLKGNPIGQPFEGHEKAVLSVSFSPDGKTLLSTSSDRTLRLWDIKSGELIAPPIYIEPTTVLSEWTVGVSSVAISPDGRTISTSIGAKARGYLHLLRGNWKSWLEVACQRWGYYYIFLDVDTEESQAATKTCKEHIWNKAEATQILIKRGRTLAEYWGDVEGAVANFQEARKINPKLDLDPKAEAQHFAAPFWVSQGENLARTGDVQGAMNKLKTALKWNSNLSFEPEIKVAQSLLESSQELVKDNYFTTKVERKRLEKAVNNFKKALEIAPGLESSPNTKEVRQLLAQSIVTKGEKLAEQSEVKEAIASYEEAKEINPEIEIAAKSWAAICRLENIWEYTADVMPACDKLVALEPENAKFKDSRGIARALTGNPKGAIEDFQAYINWLDSNITKIEEEISKTEDENVVENLKLQRQQLELQRRQRKYWVKMLNASKNPFTTEEIKNLLSEINESVPN